MAKELNERHNDTEIIAVALIEENKKAQLLKAARDVDTRIIAYADDTVLWPNTFLKYALAPFEDARIDLIGTAKQARRDCGGGYWKSLLNYIACMSSERENLENTATYNIDGGVSVISGKTVLIRTSTFHTA